jgi:UDP-GlcNAc:undecaprenyl-phosphate/decaprenyl-phosphate GlcNAc-1-phosphate transferase
MLEVIIFVLSLFTSAFLTRWVRDLAVTRGWLSISNSDRHIHTRPVPRLGGVAIFLTLWLMVLLARWSPGNFSPHLTLKILGPATIIFFLGLVDDVFGVNAYVKFAVETIAAIGLYINGFGISQLSVLKDHSHLGWIIGLPLTILWVLSITNAFNLIDGLDGLAAGCALFATLVTCIMALLFHSEGILYLTLVLAGAIAGFLRYNFNPASIFLGDCGSLFIGFLLSALALAGSQKAPTAVAIAVPVVSLGLPILDVSVAVLRRFLSCKPLFDADREHIHHKLLGRGISHKQAVLLLYGVSAGFGLLSLFLLHPAVSIGVLVFMVAGTGVLVGLRELRYHEFLELGHVARQIFKQRRIMANDINVRRAADAMLSCTTLAQFRQILQQCLRPAGIDGFGLYFSPQPRLEAEAHPFTSLKGCKLRFFWDGTVKHSEANWTLSFSLRRRNGERLGAFTLYRKEARAPLRLDVDVFKATGFFDSVADVLERMEDSWFAKAQLWPPELSAGKAATALVAGRGKQSLPLPSAT